jgi:hypothetical protein
MGTIPKIFLKQFLKILGPPFYPDEKIFLDGTSLVLIGKNKYIELKKI